MSAKPKTSDKVLIRRALADPEFRALAKIVGALLPLNERARRRVLYFAADSLHEEISTRD